MPAYLKRQESGVATLLALLWVVHPMNGEIVNYATQRSEAMMALAFLATLYFGVRAITAERSPSWYAASIVACAFGMACKESMVVAPVLVSRNTRAQGVGQGRDGRARRCAVRDGTLV